MEVKIDTISTPQKVTHVIEESQHRQPVFLFHGRANVAILFLVEHHMQLHWETLSIDVIFAAHCIIVAPMEMQLIKLIDAIQRAAGN